MAAAAAVVIAAVVLLGWAIDAHVLRAFSTGAVAMKTNAAVGVVMAGVAVLVKVGDPPRRRRLAGDGLGLACTVLGLVTLAEYVTGWQPGIDELLFSEPLTAVRTSSPNRMAASAALCLVLLGAAVVLMGRGRRAHRRGAVSGRCGRGAGCARAGGLRLRVVAAVPVATLDGGRDAGRYRVSAAGRGGRRRGPQVRRCHC